jgi:hypothetical protein
MTERGARAAAPDGALVVSRRLGALTGGQLQAALDRFGLGRLVGAEAVASGNWGQNVFVTSTAGAFVLRGAPFYPWQLAEEQFFARRPSTPTPTPDGRRPSVAESPAVQDHDQVGEDHQQGWTGRPPADEGAPQIQALPRARQRDRSLLAGPSLAASPVAILPPECRILRVRQRT